MKITKLQTGYRIRCTDVEFETLQLAVDQIEAQDPWDLIDDTSMRKSWVRRVKAGAYLRVDDDRRTW